MFGDHKAKEKKKKKKKKKLFCHSNNLMSDY